MTKCVSSKQRMKVLMKVIVPNVKGLTGFVTCRNPDKTQALLDNSVDFGIIVVEVH